MNLVTFSLPMDTMISLYDSSLVVILIWSFALPESLMIL